MAFQKTLVIRVARFGAQAPRASLARAAADHAEDFRPAATRYRRQLRRFARCAALGALLVLASLALPEASMPWVAVPGMALIGVALALFFTLPSLTCPACARNADAAPECYCPACGSEQLKVNRLCGSYCNGCGRRFGSHKYRTYPIHFCTHCGVVLDEAGV